MRNRRAHYVVALGCMLSFAWGCLATTAAYGLFSASATSATSVSSATLAAPSDLTLSSVDCVAGVSISVKLTWTQTSSGFADGYQVLRSLTAGGPYSAIGSVSGISTLTFTDSSVSFLTPYYYVVKAKKHKWTSPNSPERLITTLTSLCA
ncbi:MAG TPA: hypothetical protein VM600_07410 [Actinomycetota bacterium]|nr:hypothetical protein [Actinomycetota bacterium]